MHCGQVEERRTCMPFPFRNLPIIGKGWLYFSLSLFLFISTLSLSLSLSSSYDARPRNPAPARTLTIHELILAFFSLSCSPDYMLWFRSHSLFNRGVEWSVRERKRRVDLLWNSMRGQPIIRLTGQRSMLAHANLLITWVLCLSFTW